MSRQITLKFSQSIFRIQTRTRSRRHFGGPLPRRLTKTLQPDRHLNVPRTDRSHTSPETVPTSDWRECVSNPRLTIYARIPKQNRTGV